MTKTDTAIIQSIREICHYVYAGSELSMFQQLICASKITPDKPCWELKCITVTDEYLDNTMAGIRNLIISNAWKILDKRNENETNLSN